MSEIVKRALPYVLLALLAGWSLSLQREVTQLEQANAALTEAFTTMESVAATTDAAVVEWAEAHEAVTERTERIHAELGKADDHHWGDMRLPDEYVRVLREAGILHPGCDAPVASPSRSGDTEAEGNDEQGASGVRPCR